MSTKLTGYVWDGCAASGMKLSSVAIMARLADFSNDEGMCWPSIETIARQIGAGMSTVRTAIARLEAEGWLTRKARRQGIDYGVVFGAFAGAVFYVATAANITRVRLIAYFMTSFIVGVLAAGLVGSKLSQATGYSDRPLDALGAVVVAAMTIKVLTFFNSQDLGSLFSILSRFRGGGASNGNK